MESKKESIGVSIRDFWVGAEHVDIASYWKNLKVDGPTDTNTFTNVFDYHSEQVDTDKR